jgi:hypothetical protein
MSEDIRTQQRWLIAGVATLVLLFILVIVALVRSVQPREGDAQVGHRFPAAQLAYCGPTDSRLCVVSFNQVEEGDMIVSLQVPRLFYPEFDLVINRFGVESTYECKEEKGISMGVTCAGASQVPGETLQFKVISRKDGLLLAEGKFQIIGIAISTPEDQATPTGTVTAFPTAIVTETPFPTPLPPTQSIATLTPPVSYPNPTSYP